MCRAGPADIRRANAALLHGGEPREKTCRSVLKSGFIGAKICICMHKLPEGGFSKALQLVRTNRRRPTTGAAKNE